MVNQSSVLIVTSHLTPVTPMVTAGNVPSFRIFDCLPPRINEEFNFSHPSYTPMDTWQTDNVRHPHDSLCLGYLFGQDSHSPWISQPVPASPWPFCLLFIVSILFIKKAPGTSDFQTPEEHTSWQNIVTYHSLKVFKMFFLISCRFNAFHRVHPSLLYCLNTGLPVLLRFWMFPFFPCIPEINSRKPDVPLQAPPGFLMEWEQVSPIISTCQAGTWLLNQSVSHCEVWQFAFDYCFIILLLSFPTIRLAHWGQNSPVEFWGSRVAGNSGNSWTCALPGNVLKHFSTIRRWLAESW